MTVPAPEIEALAEDLLRARDSRTTLDPPTKRIDAFTLADGYAVGAAIAARRTEAGRRRIVGQKVGLTYRAIWDRIGLEHPVWAPVYDDGIHEGADKVSVAGLVAPKVEIEVILGFDRPVPVRAGREQIAAAVSWAALGYEIVDCHYPGWGLTPPDLVADFGCHAGLAVGTRRQINRRGGAGALGPGGQRWSATARRSRPAAARTCSAAPSTPCRQCWPALMRRPSAPGT